MSATVKMVECKVCHNTIEMKTFHVSKARYCFAQKGWVCEDCLRHKKEHGTFEGRVCLESEPKKVKIETEPKKVNIETEKEQCPQTCSVSEAEEVKEQLQENNKVNSAVKSGKKKKSGKITLVRKWFAKSDAEGTEEQGEQTEQAEQAENFHDQENQ